jgi:hypothetical protein
MIINKCKNIVLWLSNGTRLECSVQRNLNVYFVHITLYQQMHSYYTFLYLQYSRCELVRHSRSLVGTVIRDFFNYKLK